MQPVAKNVLDDIEAQRGALFPSYLQSFIFERWKKHMVGTSPFFYEHEYYVLAWLRGTLYVEILDSKLST